MTVHGDGALARRATRRTFLKYGAAGVTSAAVAGTALARWPAAGQAANVTDGYLEVFVNEGYVAMVDRSLVYMRGFGTTATARDAAHPSLTIGPVVFREYGDPVESRFFPLGAARPDDCAGRPTPLRRVPNTADNPIHVIRRRYWASYFPRRTIIAEEGSRIKLLLKNRICGEHRFAIDGVCYSDPIAASGTKVEFDAPAPGTYVYHDPTNAPVERMLGLSGVLIVVPRGLPWNVTADTAEFERQWVWIIHDIDSQWARRAAMGATIDPKATPPVPDYFCINDRSGFHSIGISEDEEINRHTHEETIPQGFARPTDVRDFSKDGTLDTVVTGQAIRLANTGVGAHQLHFHGNHVWTLRRTDQTFSRSVATVSPDFHIDLQQWEDVVELDPLDRKDIVLPIKPPPDVLAQVRRAQAEDWHYPMHCHAEMSQTAGGGLYPGGAVADWILAAPLAEGVTS